MNVEKVILTPGEVIRELRLKKGWTQKDLSKLTGIAVSNISNIEHNRSQVGEVRAILIATALEVSPAIIMFPNGYRRKDLIQKVREIKQKLKSCP